MLRRVERWTDMAVPQAFEARYSLSSALFPRRADLTEGDSDADDDDTAGSDDGSSPPYLFSCSSPLTGHTDYALEPEPAKVESSSFYVDRV